jgi:DNA-binding response OmpR family regulator
VAVSEAAALTVAEATRPPFAVVDVLLWPGDGRVVARQLVERYGTAVLFATSLCGDISDLAQTGAVACLPKPYAPRDIPAALEAISQIRAGLRPEFIPDHMKVLTR